MKSSSPADKPTGAASSSNKGHTASPGKFSHASSLSAVDNITLRKKQRQRISHFWCGVRRMKGEKVTRHNPRLVRNYSFWSPHPINRSTNSNRTHLRRVDLFIHGDTQWGLWLDKSPTQRCQHQKFVDHKRRGIQLSAESPHRVGFVILWEITAFGWCCAGHERSSVHTTSQCSHFEMHTRGKKHLHPTSWEQYGDRLFRFLLLPKMDRHAVKISHDRIDITISQCETRIYAWINVYSIHTRA